MTHKISLGKQGEDFACEYLVKKGYQIVDRNVQKPWGELDIVAQEREGTLVFVEVKTMQQINNKHINTGDGGIRPEDQMTSAKMRKLKKAAQLYAGHYPEKIREDRGWRIDVIALTLNPAEGLSLTNIKKDFAVNHYENVC